MKTPCKSCPWRRDSLAGALAVQGQPGLAEGFTWTRMLTQAIGPFWLPCHSRMDPEVTRRGQDPDTVSPCVGAGIFRTHINYAMFDGRYRPSYPADTANVFASPAEFLAHHTRLTVHEARAAWAVIPLVLRMSAEIAAANISSPPGGKEIKHPVTYTVLLKPKK